MNRYVIIPVVGALAIGAFILKPGSINAQDTQKDTLIQKLVTRFNLKESEVQAVFDEHRTERQQQMQVRFEERLNQLVADGKITAEQKQLIVNKHQEMQAEHQNDWQSKQSLTPEERRTHMEAEHNELKAWAEQNGIDLSAVMIFGGRGMGHGMRGGW